MPQPQFINMTKKDLEIKLHDLLTTLTVGDAKDRGDAKKEIEKLWNHNSKIFEISSKVALDFIPRFDEIKNNKNKEAFVSGLKFFFLVLSDDYFDILKDFTLKVIQNPDGHIRMAMFHVADWLYASLSSRCDPFVYPEGKPLSEKQKVEQIEARKQYLNYVKEVKELI
jgi:hypothetical protein